MPSTPPSIARAASLPRPRRCLGRVPASRERVFIGLFGNGTQLKKFEGKNLEDAFVIDTEMPDDEFFEWANEAAVGLEAQYEAILANEAAKRKVQEEEAVAAAIAAQKMANTTSARFGGEAQLRRSKRSRDAFDDLNACADVSAAKRIRTVGPVVEESAKPWAGRLRHRARKNYKS